MRTGICGINGGIFAAEPAAIADIVGDLEAMGYDSVWASEHYALPVRPRQPQAPSGRMALLDPFVSLTVAAVASSGLRLATGVVVVPLHHPAVLAKKVASVDRVSGGRFMFGVGVGYLEEEFAALGADLATRGQRFTDSIEAMTALWSGEPVDVRNASFSMTDVQARPAPISRPGPPLVFGGYAPVSYRRAVTQANGWYGYWLDADAAATCVRGLRLAQRQLDRPGELGPLEVSVTPPRDLQLTEQVVDRYQRAGVDRLVILPPAAAFRGLDPMRRFLSSMAGVLLGPDA